MYLKGREEVAGLLAQAGAYHAALMIEEQSVLKDVRSRANRVANCDAANLRRTSAAALRQIEAIELLERTGRLAAMPPALREMAELRMAHPYLNLTELARGGGPRDCPGPRSTTDCGGSSQAAEQGGGREPMVESGDPRSKQRRTQGSSKKERNR